MQGSRLVAAALALLTLAACVDTGPPSEAQISQDIRSTLWNRNQLTPVIPGAPPPVATGGESRRIFP